MTVGGLGSAAGAPIRSIGKGAKTNFAAQQRRRNPAPATKNRKPGLVPGFFVPVNLSLLE